MTAIRVALVDDQALFRAGIRMLVDSQPDLEVVAEAGDGREGVAMVRTTRPDVVLMDVRMPVLDGLSATAELLADPDPPRIVVLTTFDLDEAAARAIRARWFRTTAGSRPPCRGSRALPISSRRICREQ